MHLTDTIEQVQLILNWDDDNDSTLFTAADHSKNPNSTITTNTITSSSMWPSASSYFEHLQDDEQQRWDQHNHQMNASQNVTQMELGNISNSQPFTNAGEASTSSAGPAFLASSFLNDPSVMSIMEPTPIAASGIQIVEKIHPRAILAQADDTLLGMLQLLAGKRSVCQPCASFPAENLRNNGSNSSGDWTGDWIGNKADNNSSTADGKRSPAAVLPNNFSAATSSSLPRQQQLDTFSSPSSLFASSSFPQQQVSNEASSSSTLLSNWITNVQFPPAQPPILPQQRQRDSGPISSSAYIYNENIRGHHEIQWHMRFKELCDFRATNGHCVVPHSFKSNRMLAQWVKRQRYQYKLKQDGQHSTLTNDREQMLTNLGFTWDTHATVWEERLAELKQYNKQYGDCNVPTRFPPNQTLAVWVKCQRRQYRLLQRGKTSNMTPDRMQRLDDVGFVWNPRQLGA